MNIWRFSVVWPLESNCRHTRKNKTKTLQKPTVPQFAKFLARLWKARLHDKTSSYKTSSNIIRHVLDDVQEQMFDRVDHFIMQPWTSSNMFDDVLGFCCLQQMTMFYDVQDILQSNFQNQRVRMALLVLHNKKYGGGSCRNCIGLHMNFGAYRGLQNIAFWWWLGPLYSAILEMMWSPLS